MTKKNKKELTLMVKPKKGKEYIDWPYQWAEKWEVKHLSKFGWKKSKKLKETLDEMDKELVQ
jgi:hypothetical protein